MRSACSRRRPVRSRSGRAGRGDERARPRGLGLVHREVGREEEVGRAPGVLGVDGDADARRERDGVALEVGRELPAGTARPLSARGSPRPRSFRGEDPNSSPPRRPKISPGSATGGASSPARAGTRLPREPVRVVQGLEVVEVEEEERERAGEVGVLDLALELEVKPVAVREARDGVGGLGRGSRRPRPEPDAPVTSRADAMKPPAPACGAEHAETQKTRSPTSMPAGTRTSKFEAPARLPAVEEPGAASRVHPERRRCLGRAVPLPGLGTPSARAAAFAGRTVPRRRRGRARRASRREGTPADGARRRPCALRATCRLHVGRDAVSATGSFPGGAGAGLPYRARASRGSPARR